MTVTARPSGPHPHAQRRTSQLTRGTLVAAALGVCVAQVALAIPAVLNGLFQADLRTSSSQLTWISDSFLVPITLLELSFGVFGDLFGRKRLLVGGALVLALGEALSVLTPGAGSSTGTRVLVLWVGQIIAGIGAAALFPTTLAIVAAGTHTAAERARTITIWAAALSLGAVISPVVGGAIVKIDWGGDPNASWRWALLVVVALGLISASVSLAARDSSAPEGRSLDWPGQVTIAIALFALLFGVIQAPTVGWSGTEVLAGFVVAAVCFVAFVVAELHTETPLLELRLFRDRPFAIAATVTLLAMFATLGTGYATSIRLTAIQHFSPLQTSAAFVLLNGMALVLMPITRRALEFAEPRWVLGAGAILLGAGDFWLAAIPAENGSLTGVLPPCFVSGLGFALAISAVSAVMVNQAPHHLAGMASAATSMIRDLGFTLGPAVIGTISLGIAAGTVSDKLAAHPSLQQALDTFNASAAHASGAHRSKLETAIHAVNSGPLGANSVPGNPLKNAAFHALSNGYAIGYIVSGCCAVLAAAIAVLVLRGHRPD